MAPFWTFFLGWLILGDGITSLEIFALICSFGGVLLIATTDQSSESAESEKAGIVGVTGLSGMKA